MTHECITKIILVMGITGAGKSHLIREISGQDVSVGHELESHTRHIQQVGCDIAGHPVMILDTPGFDDTHRSDTEVLTEITSHLVSLYKNGFRVSGIIYLHNICDNRIRGSSRKNPEMLEKLCGKEALQNVVMLTNRWGMVDESKALTREKELKERFWKDCLQAGCIVDRYQDKSDLIRIFGGFLTNEPTALEIQQEMVDRNIPLSDTAAGKAVNIELTRQKEIHREKLDANVAEYEKQTKAMKAIMDEERMKLEDRLRQLESDKIMMLREQQWADEEVEEKIAFKFAQKIRKTGKAVAHELEKLATIRENEGEKAERRERAKENVRNMLYAVAIYTIATGAMAMAGLCLYADKDRSNMF